MEIENKTKNIEISPASYYGLICEESKSLIPLKKILVKAQIIENFVRVILTHEYINLSNKMIDTIFVFPKDPDAVFDSLVAEFEDSRRVIGKVAEKREAKIKYIEEKNAGNTVILTEQSLTTSNKK